MNNKCDNMTTNKKQEYGAARECEVAREELKRIIKTSLEWRLRILQTELNNYYCSDAEHDYEQKRMWLDRAISNIDGISHRFKMLQELVDNKDIKK